MIWNIDSCSLGNPGTYDVFQECMTPFFESKSDYESCVSTLENRLKLMLEE
jgi:multiple sugar transport system substrate-binding protein